MGDAPHHNVSAAPAAAADRLYWATSDGRLICAEADSGDSIWERKESDLILPGLTVANATLVASEARIARAFDALSGKTVWSRDLPAESVRRPREAFDGVLLRLKDQILLVSTDDGAALSSWVWPGSRTRHVTAGSGAAFAVRCDPRDALVVGRDSARTPGCQSLRLGRDGSIVWELASPVRSPRIVWHEDSGWLFETCGAVALVDVGIGRREQLLSLSDTQLLLTPAIDNGRGYITTVEGELICFKVPSDARRGRSSVRP